MPASKPADPFVGVWDLISFERRTASGEEQFETFEENALAKARHFFERSGGMPTFADDSGMCVDALAGEPGVYSKRWSGRLDLEDPSPPPPPQAARKSAAANAIAASANSRFML